MEAYLGWALWRYAIWGRVPFQWGWVPFHSMGLGPLAIDWREDLLQIPRSMQHPSAFYGARCGSVPLLIQISGAGSPFIIWGVVPFCCVGLDPPSNLWGWVPFQAMALGPLLLYGAESPFIRWS